MENLDRLLKSACDIARAGAAIAMAAYGTTLSSRRKDDGTWVTEADEAAESAMRALIAERFPRHSVLGEEEGLTGATGGAADPGAPKWILDPIDGTNNFMGGVPIWATLVGFEVDGELLVGAIEAPALGESYDGGRGLGARMNGDAIGVSDRPLGESLFVATGYEFFTQHGLDGLYREIAARAARSRGLGDFWGHTLVARGAAGCMVEPELSTWDYGALVPIVEEAGGRITTLDGGPLAHGGTCLTTNGVVHDEILALARA